MVHREGAIDCVASLFDVVLPLTGGLGLSRCVTSPPYGQG